MRPPLRSMRLVFLDPFGSRSPLMRIGGIAAEEILVMKDGRIAGRGPAQEVVERPREPYTRALMKAVFESGQV